MAPVTTEHRPPPDYSISSRTPWNNYKVRHVRMLAHLTQSDRSSIVKAAWRSSRSSSYCWRDVPPSSNVVVYSERIFLGRNFELFSCKKCVCVCVCIHQCTLLPSSSSHRTVTWARPRPITWAGLGQSCEAPGPGSRGTTLNVL